MTTQIPFLAHALYAAIVSGIATLIIWLDPRVGTLWVIALLIGLAFIAQL